MVAHVSSLFSQKRAVHQLLRGYFLARRRRWKMRSSLRQGLLRLSPHRSPGKRYLPFRIEVY